LATTCSTRSFCCARSDRQRIDLVAALYELIEHATDQVLVIDLGPVDGRASICVSSIGRAYANPERTAVIV